MFSIFKRKRASDQYFPISTDIHSHILPGVDDGSPDLETSIHLVKGLMKLGVKRTVATPHIIGDMYRNDATTINAALNLLKSELKNQQMEFEVFAAAEYMLDGYFLELLDKKIPLLTIHDKIVLTEFSYSSRPDHIENMSFAIITEGYQPILAHPERYGYFHKEPRIYERLKELGFALQVNLLSLTGYYGKDVAKSAHYIIKNDLAAYVATDLHHDRHLAALQDRNVMDLFRKHLSHKTWNEF